MSDHLVLILMIALSLSVVLIALAIDDHPPTTGASPDDRDPIESDDTPHPMTSGGGDVLDESEGDEDARGPAGLPAEAR